MPDYKANIEAASAKLDGIIAEQYRYPREVLGKTRPLHPDEALRYAPVDLRERELEARGALSGIYWSKHHARIEKARASRFVPDKIKARALLDDYFAKHKHAKALRDLGLEFVPLSEIVLANLDSELAWQLYQNALDKNGAKHASDCRAPKHKRRLLPVITDEDGNSYIETGKFKTIDGVRVPVVERVGP